MSTTVTEADSLEKVEYDPDEHTVICEFCGEVDGDGSLEAYYDHMAEVHDMPRKDLINE